MPRTITVKMAKPSEADFDCVHDFLKGLEIILEEGCIPKADLDDDIDLPNATAEPVFDWLEKQWRDVSRSWSRVLWAGKTAIDNCCDPNADVLEFKPEIKKTLEMHDDLVLCARVAANLVCLCHVMNQTCIACKAKGIIAKAEQAVSVGE